jgi:heme exporter protein A
MLSCDNLSASYNQHEIVSGLGFSLLPGSLLHLKGANGSGKTTILKIIAGLATPTQGKVYWNKVYIYEELDIYHRYCVDYLGHKNAIKGNLTVEENLQIWCNLRDSHELILPAIHFFQLEHLLHIECKKLSAGWIKRVALARLLLNNAKLWLLDEPDAHLDAQGRDLLLRLIEAKTSNGGIVILTSHSLNNIPNSISIELEGYCNV